MIDKCKSDKHKTLTNYITKSIINNKETLIYNIHSLQEIVLSQEFKKEKEKKSHSEFP